MHCAFAKYEQGFKRKNEYLERRRVKRREEIERGVREEMGKRGLADTIDQLTRVGGGERKLTTMPTAASRDMDNDRIPNVMGVSSKGIGAGNGDDSVIPVGGMVGGQGSSLMGNQNLGISAGPEDSNISISGRGLLGI